MEDSTLLAGLEETLRANQEAPRRFQAGLEAIARAFGAATVTLHRADPRGSRLHLVASKGLPESLLPATREIPFGKGMAGLCALRLEPVTVCNLQTDDSGCARPAARETGVAGAIVVPVLAPDSGLLVGTLGIGKRGEHQYTGDERAALARCARALAAVLASMGAP